MALGERIRELRQKRNLTQDELAVSIGKDRTNIASYEIGRSVPTLDTLTKIADLFKVSVDYLLERTNDPHEIYKISDSEGFSSDEYLLFKKFMFETEELLRSKGNIDEDKLKTTKKFMEFVFREELEEEKKKNK